MQSAYPVYSPASGLVPLPRCRPKSLALVECRFQWGTKNTVSNLLVACTYTVVDYPPFLNLKLWIVLLFFRLHVKTLSPFTVNRDPSPVFKSTAIYPTLVPPLWKVETYQGHFCTLRYVPDLKSRQQRRWHGIPDSIVPRLSADQSVLPGPGNWSSLLQCQSFRLSDFVFFKNVITRIEELISIH